jgi:hypothetical protein
VHLERYLSARITRLAEGGPRELHGRVLSFRPTPLRDSGVGGMSRPCSWRRRLLDIPLTSRRLPMDQPKPSSARSRQPTPQSLFASLSRS